MRVHGDKVLKRRENVKELGHYSEAREILQEDFHNMCGYCGKDCKVMFEKFHIDHFVPKSLDSTRENDYYNLVFACSKCNLSKSNKWPTKDINKSHDDEKGFVDPASEEFDHHIERNAYGYVVGKTTLGKNMCKELHLDIRRTDIFWKMGKLMKQQERLEELFEKGMLKDEEKDYYIRNNRLFKNYMNKARIIGE